MGESERVKGGKIKGSDVKGEREMEREMECEREEESKKKVRLISLAKVIAHWRKSGAFVVPAIIIVLLIT